MLDADGAPGMLEALERSLKVNPAFEPARVFLAEVRLDLEDYEAAAREAERVLADNPASLPALSVLAAARYFQGDATRYDDARKRALALDPRNAELYNRLAELSARNRLYRQAADFAQQAVALDPRSWRGLGILGLNQLRLGEIDGGPQEPRGVVRGRSLQRLDQEHARPARHLPEYEETRTEHFQILLHGKEAELLAPYAADLAEEAYARSAAALRVSARRSRPRRGLSRSRRLLRAHRRPGRAWPASGVCFGTVLAIDSPSAREVGQFNWGSTLWHELAHTVHARHDRQPRAALVHGRPLRPRGAPRAAGLGRRRDRGLPRAR